MLDAAAIRAEWTLDPDFLTLNHGSYGATPRTVRAAQDAWRDRLEAQPSRFFRETYPAAIRHAASSLAAFLGAHGDDLAFVENATTGCNAVLRSLRFQPGDEILVLQHVYGAVRNTIRHICERTGATMAEAAIPFPRPLPDAITEAVAAAITPRTRLAVIDHITSASALVLPIADIVRACHARGVPVLVDGGDGERSDTVSRSGVLIAVTLMAPAWRQRGKLPLGLAPAVVLATRCAQPVCRRRRRGAAA